MNYSYDEGWVATVYDLEKTKFVERGVLPEPSISEAKQEYHFSFVFSGVLSIPETGIYEFMTRSDDGSVLYIGRDKIVDNDGSHAAIVATGRVALEKGLHNLTLRYFEDYEGQSLDWGWKKLDA